MVIRNQGKGCNNAMVIDRTGALHIAYIDNANDTIRYATNVSGSWAFSTLGDAEDFVTAFSTAGVRAKDNMRPHQRILPETMKMFGVRCLFLVRIFWRVRSVVRGRVIFSRQ